MSKGLKRILWRVLQVLIICLIFFFLGRQLYLNWEKVASYQWQLDYSYLIAALISVIIAFFIFSSIWRLIVLSLNKKVGYGKSFKIAYLANLGRYIPGKIWQMFGMIYLAKKEGVTEEEAVTSFGLSQLFAIPSGLLAGLVCLALYPETVAEYSRNRIMTSGITIIAVVVLVLSLLVVFFPRPIESALNGLFRMLKRRPIQLKMNKSLAAAIYGGYFLAWSLYGISFWLFLNGITAQETLLLPMAGIFIVAYQVGYLMIFAPGGLGPREGMMTLMLTPFFGPVSAAIAIAARIWLIIAEALSAVIALNIKSTEKIRGQD